MDSENEEPSLDSIELRKRVADFVRLAVRDLTLPDSASEDLSQIVFIKLLTLNTQKLRAIENFNSYLFKMARNEALRFQQKSKPTQHVQFDDEVESLQSDRFEYAHQVESDILLREVWQTLRDDERELLQLIIIGYKESDMASRLGLSYDVVRKRVSRLRAKLRDLILG